MKSLRRLSCSAALASALLLAACQPPDARDMFEVTALQTGSATSLVRADPDHEIQHLAVSRGQVFFASFWQGVFRVPKAGGSVSAVEQRNASVHAVAANGEEVFWLSSTYDSSEHPYTHLQRRALAGGPVSTVAEGDISLIISNTTDTLQADEQAVYVLGERPVIQRFSLADSASSEVGYARQNRDDFPETPNWILDGETLYLSNCEFGVGPCQLQRIALPGGEAIDVAPLEAGDALQGVDATHLYVRSYRGILGVEKSSGTTTLLYAAAQEESLWTVLVDEQNLYFAMYGSSGLQVRSLPKTGGVAREMSPGLLTGSSLWQMVQDEDSLYILRANNVDLSSEILRLPKSAGAAPQIGPQG